MKLLISTIRLFSYSIALLLGTCYGLQAQGWQSSSSQTGGTPVPPYSNDGNYVSGMSPFYGDYAYTVINHPDGTVNLRIEELDVNKGVRHGWSFAQSIGQHHFGRAIMLLPADTLVVLEESVPEFGGDRTLWLSYYLIVPPNATQNWKHLENLYQVPVYSAVGANIFGKSLVRTADGGLLVAGTIASTSSAEKDILLVKLTASGTLVWANQYPNAAQETSVNIVENANGNVLLLKNTVPTNDPTVSQTWLMQIDPNGTLLSETLLSSNNADEAYNMVLTADGNLAMTGINKANNKGIFLQKTASDGTWIWRQDFALPDQSMLPHGLVENANGELVVGGTLTNNLTNKQDGLLMKFDAQGTPIWERKVGKSNLLNEMTQLVLAPDGGYLMGGKYFSQVNIACIAKTDPNGIIKPAGIFGNVIKDFDLDCSPSAGDQPLQNWIVRAYQDSTQVFYANTDALGNYYIECDTGAYLVSLILLNAYVGTCANNVPVSLGYRDTAQVNFAVQNLIDCPFLTVEHATSNLRPCDTAYLAIDYCNTGTITADDAYIEVELDEWFTYIDAPIAPTNVNGNVYTFPLGDIASDACGHLNITVLVDCDAVLGQSACSEVHIYPDSSCLPLNQAWSGAFLQVIGTCDADSVQFLLQNVGTAPMDVPLEYIVIEDAVLLRTGQFQLGAGESMPIKTPSNGSTWHFLAPQEPGAPGNSLPIASIEGCVGNSGNPASTGFINQFPQNDIDGFVSFYCRQITSSFDPNDKQAVPAGFGPEHNIFPNTDLEYTIRFQNTGTDTAFRVVLLDTLSAHLDPATIKAGASSHPYKMEIEDRGTLKFTFSNIKLPHEAVNAAGSNGFVTFRIAQKANNPIGTLIENRAGIYFDFNLPVITNTVFHTVHEPWIKLVSAYQPAGAPKLSVTAFPNPFVEQVQIVLDGDERPDLLLRLVSTDGRLVREVPFDHNRLLLDRDGLVAGLYFYTVVSAGKVLGAGKLVAEAR